jgi:hypothetical protein
MRVREEVLRVNLYPSGGASAGRHLSQMREAQADACANVTPPGNGLSGDRASHLQAFGFVLALTIRSQ